MHPKDKMPSHLKHKVTTNGPCLEEKCYKFYNDESSRCLENKRVKEYNSHATSAIYAHFSLITILELTFLILVID